MMVGSTHAKKSRLVLGLGAVLCLFLATPAFAQMPTAMLSSVFPPGGQIGTETEVAITGENLDEATALQFSHPGISAMPKMNPPDEFSPNPTPMANTVPIPQRNNFLSGGRCVMDFLTPARRYACAMGLVALG